VGARWPAFWRNLFRFDDEKIEPWMALRNAVAVALPLAAGAAAGNPRAGLVMSIGALNVAVSDGADPYRIRARRMWATSFLCGLAVFIGGLLGPFHLPVILFTAAAAFAAGMMVAISDTAASIGLITLITFVVFSGQAPTPRQAAIYGLLALAGGGLQTLLASALWPLRRHAPERRALAELYAALSKAAGAPAHATESPPASAESTRAQQALASLRGDRSVEAERHLALLGQAERIRLSLLALARLRARLAREAAAETGTFDRGLRIASEVLRSVAESLQPRGDRRAPEALQEMDSLAAAVRAASAPMVQDARGQMEALAGQLRAAAELAAHATPAGAIAFERSESRRPRGLRLAGAGAILRANLNWRSSAFRHAVRLAACVALGSAWGRMLDPQRGYWIPMTVAIVLKPDFTATFTRGVLRLAGTLIGLAVASGLYRLLSPSLGVEALLIAIFVFLMRGIGQANYGILAAALAALIVVMLAITGVAPQTVIALRGLDTLVGGVIALAAYAAWPTFERTQIREAVARMLDAYRAYFQVIRDAYLQPEVSFSAALDEARVAARLARSNLEAALARLSAEPGGSEAYAALTGLLANSHRLIHACMALEAGLARSRTVPARKAFRTFANDTDLTLYFLSAALGGSPISREDLPNLREDHYQLVHSGDGGVDRYALVNVETDRITNSLNTLAEETLHWLGR
jgi:uncharacterized membrane protein YccC